MQAALSGRRAPVTGAGSGIGAGIAAAWLCTDAVSAMTEQAIAVCGAEAM